MEEYTILGEEKREGRILKLLTQVWNCHILSHESNGIEQMWPGCAHYHNVWECELHREKDDSKNRNEQKGRIKKEFLKSLTWKRVYKKQAVFTEDI